MNRLTYALALAGILLLTSCLDRKGDSPSGPTIPPRSLFSGKVEERTTTLQDASGKATSRIIETYGREGELLRRDSLELTGGVETLRLSRVYKRDSQGYLTAITTRRVTTGGESQEEERIDYLDYSPGIRLVKSQTTYDGAQRKLTETTYQYLGLEVDRSTEKIYTYPASGSATTEELHTQYRRDGAFEIATTYREVPSATEAGKKELSYTQTQWRRRDIYGRTLQQEVLYYDTTKSGAEQDRSKPLRLELNVWQYNSYGDLDVHSFSVYTPRKTSGATETAPTTPPASSSTTAPSTQPQPYLELSDLLVYEFRYRSADRNGFPTSCEVVETRGLQKVKTTTTRQFGYRLFATTPAN